MKTKIVLPSILLAIVAMILMAVSIQKPAHAQVNLCCDPIITSSTGPGKFRVVRQFQDGSQAVLCDNCEFTKAREAFENGVPALPHP